jgi:hypothetical protein
MYGRSIAAPQAPANPNPSRPHVSAFLSQMPLTKRYFLVHSLCTKLRHDHNRQPPVFLRLGASVGLPFSATYTHHFSPLPQAPHSKQLAHSLQNMGGYTLTRVTFWNGSIGS